MRRCTFAEPEPREPLMTARSISAAETRPASPRQHASNAWTRSFSFWLAYTDSTVPTVIVLSIRAEGTAVLALRPHTKRTSTERVRLLISFQRHPG